MIVLHGWWLPHQLDLEPSIAIWAEDTIEALNFMRNRKSNPTQSNSEDSIKQKRTIHHQFSLGHDKLQGLLDQLLDTHHNSDFDVASISLAAEIMVDLPVINSTPIVLEYFRFIKQRYDYSKNEQIIMDKLTRLINPYLSEDLDQITNQYGEESSSVNRSIHTKKVKVPIVVFPLSTLQYLLENLIIQFKSSSVKSELRVRMADDLWYLCQINSWVKHKISMGKVFPKLISQHDLLLYLGLQATDSDVHHGWWFLNNYELRQEIHQLTDSMPKLLTKIMEDTTEFDLRRDIVSKETSISVQDRLERITVPGDVERYMLNNMTNWFLNTSVRNSENISVNIQINRFTTSQQFEEFFNQANISLTNMNALFCSELTDNIRWFIRKFNSWSDTGQAQSVNMLNWQLSLVLIPPEADPIDTWYLSFLIRNRDNSSIVLSVEQIFDLSDQNSIVYPEIDKKDIKLLFQLLVSSLFDEVPTITQIITKDQVQPFIELSYGDLKELLGPIGEKIKEKGFDLYLPRNVKNKFVSRDDINLEIDINVNRGTSLSVIDYDINVMIEGDKYDLNEILQLAKSKSGLVEIKDKWINFDPNEAEGIKQVIENQLDNPDLLDILKLETSNMEDTRRNNKFYSFNGQILVNSNLTTELERKYEAGGLDIDDLNATLRGYQEIGVKWLRTRYNWKLGGILADDMGLGKTIQTIALLQDLSSKNELGNILVVAPTSVLGNWVDEIQRFASTLDFFIHHGTDRISSVKRYKRNLGNQKIVITSYNLVRLDFKLLSQIKWQGIILDEGQKIKNPQTKLHRYLTKLKSDFRFILTGTPIENRLLELWSLFDFLLPNYLGSKTKFKAEFIDPIEKEQDTKRTQLLQKLISPFILRRYKTDDRIIKDLPDKIERKIYCAMSKEQIALYKAITDKSLEKLQNTDGIKRRGIILSTMTKLKQVCNHPENYIQEENEVSIKRSGKFRALVDIMDTIIESDEKVLIFSQYRVMCNLIKKLIEEKFSVKTHYLHGGITQQKRQEMIETFNSSIGSAVFVISIRAGGTGLNLHSANHVIHYDRWWNPAVETQASDRAYRIGQRKDVMVYKLISKGTIEEMIDQIIEDKKDLTKEVIGGIQQDFTSLDDDQLQNLLQLRSILED